MARVESGNLLLSDDCRRNQDTMPVGNAWQAQIEHFPVRSCAASSRVTAGPGQRPEVEAKGGFRTVKEQTGFQLIAYFATTGGGSDGHSSNPRE